MILKEKNEDEENAKIIVKEKDEAEKQVERIQ